MNPEMCILVGKDVSSSSISNDAILVFHLKKWCSKENTSDYCECLTQHTDVVVTHCEKKRTTWHTIGDNVF